MSERRLDVEADGSRPVGPQAEWTVEKNGLLFGSGEALDLRLRRPDKGKLFARNVCSDSVSSLRGAEISKGGAGC